MVDTILRIMETWPLHLVLQTPTGDLHVGLAENVILKRGGVLVDPGTLKPGQRVRILRREANGSVAELEICD
jgi:hypothetical protein